MPQQKRSYQYGVKNWRTYNQASLSAARLADDMDAGGLVIPVGSAERHSDIGMRPS